MRWIGKIVKVGGVRSLFLSASCYFTLLDWTAIHSASRKRSIDAISYPASSHPSCIAKPIFAWASMLQLTQVNWKQVAGFMEWSICSARTVLCSAYFPSYYTAMRCIFGKQTTSPRKMCVAHVCEHPITIRRGPSTQVLWIAHIPAAGEFNAHTHARAHTSTLLAAISARFLWCIFCATFRTSSLRWILTV